jgi:hypothetical protein
LILGPEGLVKKRSLAHAGTSDGGHPDQGGPDTGHDTSPLSKKTAFSPSGSRPIFSLLAAKSGVGIADRQAAQDRQLLRDVQLRADDLRIPDD